MQQIEHKKNEIFEVELYKDNECTEAFDFTNAKDLYIEPKNGNCTPIFALSNKLSALNVKARIFTPIWYLGWRDGISPQTPLVTLDDILCGDESGKVNLSKYIPEDNTVLFLDEKTRNYYEECFRFCQMRDFECTQFFAKDEHKKIKMQSYLVSNKLTIFLPHGTQSELQKAEEVAEELKEKYGVEELNLFVLHCFARQDYILNIYGNCLEDSCLADNVCNFNKIITTNSTGILKPEYSNERLQVIDGKEIFEEYLKTER